MVEKLQELLEQKKYAEIHKMLESLNSADIPSIFDELDEEQIVIVYRLLSKDMAADVFVELGPDMQENLINAFSDKELKNVLDDIFMDDTVDLIEEMPASVVKRILRAQNSEDRKMINELLRYPEDSAGSIMTTEFVDLKENMTVEKAIEKIRKVGDDVESIYVCYVLTLTRQLIGIVSLKDLIMADKVTLVKDIMDKNFIKVSTLEEQEEVAKKFDKYDEISLPVVDNEDRLVGIVTVDDAMDVMHEEMDEDFEKMAAITPSEDTYFKTSVFKHARNRIFWLLVLMISATVTGGVITKYEDAFAAIPLLVAFLPMVMGTGGNCGSQSSTLIIRGLANDEIKLKDFYTYLETNNYDKDNQIMNEINYYFKYYDLKPAIYIAYDRLSYCGVDVNSLRITIDSNLRSRNSDLNLELGDAGKCYFKDKNYIMEIKTLGSMPLWLVRSLSELKNYPTSFSSVC